MTDRALTLSDNYARKVSLSDVQEELLRRVMEGESVISICKADDMPSRSTVFKWLNDDPQFFAAYWIAKAWYTETAVEEMRQIADAKMPTYVDESGNRRVDPAAVAQARLRIDTRKWMAGKLNPRRYGDSSTLNLNDVRETKRPRSKEEIFARLASIAGTLGGNEEDED